MPTPELTRSWAPSRRVILVSALIVVAVEIAISSRSGSATVTAIYLTCATVWVLAAFRGPLRDIEASIAVGSTGFYAGTAATVSPDGVLVPVALAAAIAMAVPLRPARSVVLAAVFLASFLFAYQAQRLTHGPLQVP